MKYTSTDFISLMGEVENQGGEHVDQTCTAEEILFKQPDGTTQRVMSSGCGLDVLFDVPYDPSSTVLVPEPVLEVDEGRSGWDDPDNGDHHPTHKTKMVQDPHSEDPSKKVALVEYVEREGELLEGGTATLLPVRVCAQEDNVGMWPRFQHVIKDPRSR